MANCCTIPSKEKCSVFQCVSTFVGLGDPVMIIQRKLPRKQVELTSGSQLHRVKLSVITTLDLLFGFMLTNTEVGLLLYRFVSSFVSSLLQFSTNFSAVCGTVSMNRLFHLSMNRERENVLYFRKFLFTLITHFKFTLL